MGNYRILRGVLFFIAYVPKKPTETIQNKINKDKRITEKNTLSLMCLSNKYVPFPHYLKAVHIPGGYALHVKLHTIKYRKQ